MASSVVRGDVIVVAPVPAGASPSETVKNLKEEKEKLHCLILLQVCTLAGRETADSVVRKVFPRPGAMPEHCSAHLQIQEHFDCCWDSFSVSKL